jgi:hypothetical protein
MGSKRGFPLYPLKGFYTEMAELLSDLDVAGSAVMQHDRYVDAATCNMIFANLR